MDPNSMSVRVLVLTPTKRDAEVTEALLSQNGLEYFTCRDLSHLCAEIEKGAGAALVTDDMLKSDQISRLLALLGNEPSWSEFPIVSLMKAGAQLTESSRMLRTVAQITLLERPTATRSLISAIEAAVRGRKRQYQIRDLLASERSARQEAEKAGKTKDEFLAVLSHELRTPLNAILGWLQLLRRQKDIPARIAQGLSVIERSASLQAKLIADLLDVSRIASGKIHLEFAPVSIVDVIEAALESIGPAAQEKSIIIEKSISPTLYVFGDFGRLQQIFWNLLSNAIKFTSPNGKVSIDARGHHAQIVLTVRDNGIGIKKEFLPFVFDRFRQGDATSTRRYGGLGLGLTIVKQLTTLHRGRVEVQSNGEGQGTTFTVLLPSLVREETTQLGDESNEANTREIKIDNLALRGTKVLIVDDDPDSRTLLDSFLHEWGASVDTADSGIKALELLTRKQYDVLVSDIGMPEMDGYDLIKKVRSLPSTARNVPALALTAFARSEDKVQALEAGYHVHLTKPIEVAQLIAEVSRLLSRHQKAAPITINCRGG